MKLSKIAKFFVQTAIIGIISSVLLKIILTYYYGSKRINADYGGIYYYNWRVKYMDKKLLKSYYVNNKLNEQAYNKVLTIYTDMVQGTFKRHVISFNPKTREKKYGKERTEYPYYAYGFPDTFVLNPSSTWKIFKNDSRALDLEFEFLKLRGKFISEVYGIKFDINSPYFKSDTKKSSESKSQSKVKPGTPIKKGSYFTKVKKEKIESFFSKPENQKFINVPNVVKLTKNLIKKNSLYKIEIINNEAKMSQKLEKELMPIIQQTFQGYDITPRDVNKYFTKLAKIDLNAMETHILNRFYMLMVYVSAYVDVKGVSTIYDSENIILNNLKEKEKNNKLESEEKRKMKSLEKMLEKMRYEIILTKISQMIGLSIGSRGIFVDSKDDKRGLFEWYGSPQELKKKNFEKGKKSYIVNEELLNDEFNKIKL